VVLGEKRRRRWLRSTRRGWEGREVVIEAEADAPALAEHSGEAGAADEPGAAPDGGPADAGERVAWEVLAAPLAVILDRRR
jgi:hypothetical protein